MDRLYLISTITHTVALRVDIVCSFAGRIVFDVTDVVPDLNVCYSKEENKSTAGHIIYYKSVVTNKSVALASQTV